MRILVFGKTGQVATELQRQADVIALGRDQVDLEHPSACSDAVREYKPDAVINAAAWTAVDQAETEEARALLVNGDAPGAMARACAIRGIPFLHVSTDYVFDGSGEQPWVVEDHPSPLGAYGRTKLEGEKLVRAAGGNHAILRTSWVFSAHGANFVKTMLRLAQTRDRLTVVADQIGGPTPAADIAATLLAMAHTMRAGQDGGTFHYGGQPAVSWADFAREIFAQSGKAVEVADIPSSDYPTPAERPMNSRLECANLAAQFGIKPPQWKDGLAKVLAELGESK